MTRLSISPKRTLWFYLIVVPLLSIIRGEDPWSFIVLSDWHNAENFALRPHIQSPQKISVIQYLKQVHGGDLILIPGDVHVGHWDSPTFISKFQRLHGDHLTIPQMVEQAGSNCYTGMMELFKQGGYDTPILMAVGDHELGDNPWLASSSHTDMLSHYRQGFQRVFNRNASTGEFLYSIPIGTIPSRPLGTVFENTSYAYQHKNILFITIDVFVVTSSMSENYLNRTIGCGGEGVVVGNVQGAHLSWFESVLKEARNDPTIQYILVQGHLPILQPVRKINSSAMSICLGEDSDFFKTMQKYQVDFYFAGEVHTNTVIQDPHSKLVQVVSRGNGFNNYIVVHVTDTQLNMTLYNEIGTKARYNQQYEWFGSLSLDKSLQGYPQIESWGQLEILDLDAPLLYFDFEEIIPLGTKVVLGLNHDMTDETLMQSQMTIRNVVCRDAMINHGSFGQQYDAQISLNLVDSGALSTAGLGKVGHFTLDSRMAVWGMGPGSGGHLLSYSCWLKTNATSKNMVLIHYGETFANIKGMVLHDSGKDIFTLALRNGIPYIYRTVHSKIYGINQNLADDQWHHIAITMPSRSCLFSQVEMYVDGIKMQTALDGVDDHLFLTSSGRISIGGYGSSGAAYDTDLDLDPYEGWMDEVYIWGRSLNQTDLSHLALRAESSLLENTTLTHIILRRNEIEEQVNEDIHLTVMMLLLGLLFFIACIRYQRRQQELYHSESHDH